MDRKGRDKEREGEESVHRLVGRREREGGSEGGTRGGRGWGAVCVYQHTAQQCPQPRSWCPAT